MENLFNTATEFLQGTNIASLLSLILCLVIITIVSYAIAFVHEALNHFQVKVKENKSNIAYQLFDKAVSEARKIIINIILGLQQSVVNDLKAASADGKLTDAEKKDILNKALSSVKAQLGDELYSQLNTYIGDVDAWIVSCIHKELAEIKKKDGTIGTLLEQLSQYVSETDKSKEALENEEPITIVGEEELKE